MYVIGSDSLVHIHRRFIEDGAEAYCGHVISPVYPSDFVKQPRQNQQQCLRCQDAQWKERKP